MNSHVLWRNTDTFALYNNYANLSSNAILLDQIQKISEIDSIYLIIFIFSFFIF